MSTAPTAAQLGNLNSPAQQLFAISPSDTMDLTSKGIRCIRVGGAGDVAVLAIGDSLANGGSGTPVVFKTCGVGERLQVNVAKVMLTNTTATLLVGMI